MSRVRIVRNRRMISYGGQFNSISDQAADDAKNEDLTF
jgi:hypothetical protein